MQAHRVIFTAPGKVEFVPFELPPLEEDQILVQARYTSISPGTERAHLLAEVNTMTHAKGFPFYPGYAHVGQVVAVGREVTGYSIGQWVVSEQPHQSHVIMPAIVGPAPLPAKYRNRPWPPLSPAASFTPHYLMFPLAAGTSDAHLQGCSIFSLSKVGLHAVRRMRIELGEAVLVIGLGPIGLCAAQFARLQGAHPVVGLDPSPTRRKFALACGLDAVYASADEVKGAGAQLPRGAPPVVIEATGRPEVIPHAFQLCAKNGRVALLGSTRGITESVNFYTDVHKQGLEVVGVHALTRPERTSVPGNWTDWDDTRLILDLVCAGRLDSMALVTDVFPAARAAQAYQRVCDTPDAIAVVLDWRN